MGNCLDLPPPPPKEYRDMQKNGIKYRSKGPAVSQRSARSSSAGSISRMTGTYSNFQPYAPIYGAPPPPPPPQPLLVFDPNTGQTFPYHPPVPMVPPNPYPMNIYANGYYDYYGYDDIGIEKKSKSKKSRHRRKENGLDKNANRKSTVITTFPDPSDDVIIQGDDMLPTRISGPVIATDVHRVTAGGDIVHQTSSITTSTRATAAATTTTQTTRTENEGEQITTDIVEPLSSRPTRGSTYITYIKDVPLPPLEVEEVKTVQQTETIVTQTQTAQERESELVDTSGTSVVQESSEIFVETSEPVTNIEKLFVDETVSKTGETSKTISVSDAGISRSLILQTRSVKISRQMFDVVICGVPEDLNFIRKLIVQLNSSGISTFVSLADRRRSEEESTKAGQAIVDSKILVVILSLDSVQSAIVRDEVSLARVSSSVIFPVALDETLDVMDKINISLKLQVAGYQWTELRDRNHPSGIVLDFFVNILREEVDFLKSNPDIIDEDYGEVSNRAVNRHNLMRRRQMLRMISSGRSVTAAQFWNDQYPELSEVEWSRFRRDFAQEFRGHLDNTLPRAGQLHALDAFKRELVSEDDDVITKGQFVVFCNDEGQDEDLWERFMAFARENLAIRDVFDVESSVRLVAIQNIGRFGSPAMMSALRDLLSDPDANIRAVAAVSLSRCIALTDEVSFRLLLKTLDDSDRLVREAGCLAMGHLKATQAVHKLSDMWRNDVISHVREAASAALKEIGGEEAEDNMRVTRILSDEIRALS